MKSTLLLGMLLVSSSAMAEKIVPNIEWNQIIPNETGQAVAQSTRNLVTLGLTNSKEENDDADTEDKYSSQMVLFSVSQDLFNIEGMAVLSKYDYENDYEDEAKVLIVNAGKKINNLSVGINTNHFNSENGNFYKIGAGATYQITDLISVGGGLNRNHNNNYDLSYMDFYAGVGFTKADFFAFEVNYLYQPEEDKEKDGVTYRIEESNGLEAQGAINLGRFQLAPRLASTVSEDDDDDKNTDTSASLRAEFKINEMFFIGALVSSNTTKYEDGSDSDQDDEVRSSDVGISGRYKAEKFQIAAELTTGKSKTEYNDGSDDIESDTNAFAVFGSYFF